MELIENPQKKFLQAKFIYEDFTKLSLENFTGHNFCQISYTKTVWNLKYQGKKVIISDYGLFHGQIIV